MMTFTKTHMDFDGSVYFFREVDKMAKSKENALLHYLAMICRSWTFSRLTQEEKENCINSFMWANEQHLIKGNFEARWAIMQAMYTAFLSALGYNDDPINWREEVHGMKMIQVYDCDAEKMEKVCDDNDIPVRELVEFLLEHLDEVKEEYNLA